MKRFSFSMLALAGLLFTACSDNDAVVGNGQNPGATLSDGYMALSISMPTTPMTRAANDNFDDGDAKEYNVKDCALLLFEGDTEASATLLSVQRFNLSGDDAVLDTDDDNITSTLKVTAKINNHVPGKNLYALAMLNSTAYLHHIAATDKWNLDDADENFNGLEEGETTLSDLASVTADMDLDKLIGDEKNYFFMTNAVMSTVPGGAAPTLGAPTKNDIFQLAQLDPNKIYNTAAEAAENPAGEIMVERAVAKATLTYTPDKVASYFEIAKVEWVIDNMEPTTYLLRNPGNLSYIGLSSEYFANDYYRFVGDATTKDKAGAGLGTDKDYYRTYWCVDPTYDDSAVTPLENSITTTMLSGKNLEYTQAITTAAATNATVPARYCTENTFPVKWMDYGNTTRAVIKVTIKNAPTIYTVNGGQTKTQEGQPVYYTEEMVQNELKADITKDVAVRTILQENYTEDGSITLNTTNFTDFFNITFTRSTTTGQYTIETLTLKEQDKFGGDETAEAIQKVLDNAKGNANETVVVLQYVGGEMYYEARFKHFAGAGEPGPANPYADLAPWDVKGTENKPNNWETTPTGGSTQNAYHWQDNETKATKNYLGRYGMVRNNWYDVEISAFNGLGSPTYPEITIENYGTPDDDLVNNIAVKIHVLSWAKRTQQWGF